MYGTVVRLGWVRSPQSIEVRFGTSRAGAVDVPLYTTASVDSGCRPVAVPGFTRGGRDRRGADVVSFTAWRLRRQAERD
ncbi:hypothetical protein SUDANB58_05751 [Streptomyces sp. enrichment culture]|uniref:hypothetical protein n=1 Tax=Streptomyces sp. enrichment culture TaxID=1795815 RepID=UPI003F54DB34